MDITFLSSLVGIILLPLGQKSLEDPLVADHPNMHKGNKCQPKTSSVYNIDSIVISKNLS